jgi:hypothetical protein
MIHHGSTLSSKCWSICWYSACVVKSPLHLLVGASADPR